MLLTFSSFITSHKEKLTYGEMSHGEMYVYGKNAYDEKSLRGSVLTAKCPYSEVTSKLSNSARVSAAITDGP